MCTILLKLLQNSYKSIGQRLFSNVQAVNTAEKLAEIVMQVDQNDQEVGPISRAEVRKNYLWHRASCIFLVNSKNEFCCHLRHRNKVWCPHHWTTAFGGVVGYNETYDSNAYKELEEEAGVSGVKLYYLFKFKFECRTSNCWQQAYFAKYDGPINIQKEEIEDYQFLSVDQIREKQKKEKFTPDENLAFDKVMSEYFEQIKQTKA